MANRGNTGQRYKMSVLVGAEIEGDKILHRLICGHNYYSSGWMSPLEEAIKIVREGVGKRQRCDKCK